MRSILVLALLAPLAACSTPARNSGFLSSYEGLAPANDAVRASVSTRRSETDMAGVAKVVLEPTVVAPGAEAAWLTPEEQVFLLRELDAQLCFEMSKRYEIAAPAAPDAARVRAAVTMTRPTGRVGSAGAAAASFFIPGPVGVRAPGTLGALAVEAEMLMGPRQISAITWSRSAMAVGTDDPSLSRIGDALQFAEPFADAAAKAMTVKGAKPRKIDKPDPCATYGQRFRAEGFLAGMATGLYVPQMSGAKAAEPTKP